MKDYPEKRKYDHCVTWDHGATVGVFCTKTQSYAMPIQISQWGKCSICGRELILELKLTQR